MITVEGARIAEILGELVRVPSVNPAQEGARSGRGGEAAMARLVADWFQSLGAEVTLDEVAPDRPNVYGVWEGKTDRWSGLDTHMDTVGVEQMTGDPFSGQVADGRVWGRGAVDTKASLASALAVLEAAREAGIRPGCRLLLAGTVDEEVDATGAAALASWLRRKGITLDELAVSEPTRCGPVIAHKGVLRVFLTVHGAPAHSSQPELGRNAISAAARITLALEAEHARLHSEPGHPMLGPGTLTVTTVLGGTGLNVVPDRCVLGIDRRLISGEDPVTESDRILAIAQEASPLPVELTLSKAIRAFEQDPSAPWIGEMAAWSGQPVSSAPYCTNAWAYPECARACVVVGPGSIDQAHGVEEWVEVSQLEKHARMLARWWGLGEC